MSPFTQAVLGSIRRLTRRQWLVAAMSAVGAVALALVVSLAANPQLREAVTGDTVERRIDQYMQAVIDDDRAAALEEWRLDGGRPIDIEALGGRRDLVTSELIALNARRYLIEGIEWWRTCCEPGVIDGPKNAGLGRAVVWVDTDTGGETYFFDVVARPDTYWGDAGGSPPHNWTLRDVYPAGEKPLYATFADVGQWYPELLAAVESYFDRYAMALVACDIQQLWSHYPDLATGLDLARGINNEETHVRGMCGTQLNGVTFDLDGYAPMLFHDHGNGMDVRVHGLESWVYAHGDGGGEFIVTVTMRGTRTGGWTVVRTDEVTLPEYHEQH